MCAAVRSVRWRPGRDQDRQRPLDVPVERWRSAGAPGPADRPGRPARRAGSHRGTSTSTAATAIWRVITSAPRRPSAPGRRRDGRRSGPRHRRARLAGRARNHRRRSRPRLPRCPAPGPVAASTSRRPTSSNSGSASSPGRAGAGQHATVGRGDHDGGAETGGDLLGHPGQSAPARTTPSRRVGASPRRGPAPRTARRAGRPSTSAIASPNTRSAGRPMSGKPRASAAATAHSGSAST